MAKLLTFISLLLITSVLTHNSLQFLQDTVHQIKKHFRAIRTPSITPEEVSELVDSFIDGLVIFNDLPGRKNCTAHDFEPIYQNVENIINTLQHFDYHNSTEEINYIMEEAKGIFTLLNDMKGPCKEYGQEVYGVIEDVAKFVSRAEYLVELPVHLLGDFSTIRQELQVADQDFKAGNYTAAGNSAGSAVHEAFLWNYGKNKLE
jgi:hypothetical protein